MKLNTIIFLMFLASKTFAKPAVEWKGIIGSKNFEWQIERKVIVEAGKWDIEAGGDAPINLPGAIKAAKAELSKHVKRAPKYWKVSHIEMRSITTVHWIYVIQFSYAGELAGFMFPVQVAVLLNGTAMPLKERKPTRTRGKGSTAGR